MEDDLDALWANKLVGAWLQRGGAVERCYATLLGEAAASDDTRGYPRRRRRRRVQAGSSAQPQWLPQVRLHSRYSRCSSLLLYLSDASRILGRSGHKCRFAVTPRHTRCYWAAAAGIGALRPCSRQLFYSVKSAELTE